MGVRSAVVLLLAALAVSAASTASTASVASTPLPGWREGPLYEYRVQTRSLAGMDSAAAQYVGVLTRARLKLQVAASDPAQLNALVEDAQFTPMRTELSGGWDSPVPEDKLSWRPMRLNHTKFALRMRQGQIEALLVERGTTVWEANYLRGVANALQVVVGGNAIIKSRSPQPPNDNSTHALYAVKENLPLGDCEVEYDVSPLPKFLVNAQTRLAPAADMRRSRGFMDIVKRVDFERCAQPLYVWGSGGSGADGPNGPVQRSATARVVAEGRLGRMEIHTSVWSSRMWAGPLVRGDGAHAAAWARVNITLKNINSRTQQRVPVPVNPVVTSLTFDPSSYIEPSQLYRDSSARNSAQLEKPSKLLNVFKIDPGHAPPSEDRPTEIPDGRLKQRDLLMTQWPRMGSKYISGNMRSGGENDMSTNPRVWDAMEGATGHAFDFPRPLGSLSSNGYETGRQLSWDDIPMIDTDILEGIRQSFSSDINGGNWQYKNAPEFEMGPSRIWNEYEGPLSYDSPYRMDTLYKQLRPKYGSYLKRHHEAQTGIYPESRILHNSEDVDKLLNYLMDDYKKKALLGQNKNYNDNDEKYDLQRIKRVDMEINEDNTRVMEHPPFNPPPVHDSSMTGDDSYPLYKQINSLSGQNVGGEIATDAGTQLSQQKNDDETTPEGHQYETVSSQGLYNSTKTLVENDTIYLDLPVQNSFRSNQDSLLNHHPHGVLHYLYRNVWKKNVPSNKGPYARSADENSENGTSNWWRRNFEKVKEWFRCPKPFVKDCSYTRSVRQGSDNDRRNIADPNEDKRREQLDSEAQVALTFDPEFYAVKNRCPETVILGMVKKIAKEMQGTGTLVQYDTMMSFGDLVRMIRGCKYYQLLQMAETIPEENASELQITAWKVLRDASCHAGTGPALVAVREWLGSGRIADWEARQLLAAVPIAARVPTPNFLQYFFLRLVSDPFVSKLDGVNATAVLAFSSLVRGAHARDIRVDGYVAYMAQQLSAAYAVGDTHTIQVMIRALGKTGHPMVLKTFRPYLNGLQPKCTIFHRTAMVVSLQKVAQLHPSISRGVLFNVFRSRGEAVEVRVAALYILMSTRPPAALLRRVAEEARSCDAQMHAAVASALESAAGLTSPAAKELAQAARLALGALPRRPRGLHRSRCWLSDGGSTHPLGPGYSRAVNYIGSRDDLLPKMLYVGTSGRMGGLSLGTTQFAAMVSSMNKLLNTLVTDSNDDDFPMPQLMSEENYVNLGPRRDEPLEGHILFPLAGTQHFITFDKPSIFQSTIDLLAGAVNLVLGKEVHLSKLYFGPRYSYAVPDISGHLTFFTMESPSLLRAVGNVNDTMERVKANVTDGKLEEATLTGFNTEMNFTWAVGMRGRVGFVCPFDAQVRRFVMAYDQQEAFSVPLNFTAGALSYEEDSKSQYVIHMKPSNDGKKTLMHYKSTPYTAIQSEELQDMDPQQQTDIINTQPMHKWVWKMGPNGEFKLNVTAEIEFLNSVQMRRDHGGYDIWSLLTLPLVHTTTHNAEVTATLDLKEANVDSIVIPLRLSGDDILDLDDLESGSEEEEQVWKTQKGSNFAEQHKGNREYNLETGMLIFYEDKLVSHVIRSEYSVNFIGNSQNYSLQYFNINSPYKYETETRKINQQMLMNIQGQWGDSPLWFFEEAMSADPTSHICAKLEYSTPHQPTMNLNAKCDLSRSAERVAFLRGAGETRVCRDQMARGNLLLPACANVTLRAGFLDRYECAVSFEQPTSFAVEAAAAAFAAVQAAFPAQMDVDPLHRSHNGQLHLEVQYQPTYHGVSAWLRAPGLAAALTDVPNTRDARPWLVAHPEASVRARVADYLFKHQNEPSCVLDKTALSTFDNTTYPVDLGACWYNVSTLQDRSASSENITIQARDMSQSSRAMRIVFSLGCQLEVSDASKNLRSKRSHQSDYKGSLVVNGKVTQVTRDKPITITMQQGDDVELVEFSMVAPNLYLLNLKVHHIRVLYDGLRIVVYASNTYRAHAQGLCGTFTGEKYDDFTDPQGYIQSDPKLFAASHANVNDNCQGHAKEDQARSKKEPRFREDIILYDVVGDDWSEPKIKSEVMEAKCFFKSIDVFANTTHNCFSQEQITQCADGCQQVGSKTKPIKYHCLSGSSGPYWRSMAQRGAKVDFSMKATHTVIKRQLPLKCIST